MNTKDIATFKRFLKSHEIAQRMWNNAHTEYAVVLSQRFTVK